MEKDIKNNLKNRLMYIYINQYNFKLRLKNRKFNQIDFKSQGFLRLK